MSLAPLLNAPLVIQIHAFAAMGAFVLGLVQFIRRKGGTAHRLMGRIWVGLMLAVAISSLWIHEIRLWGPFSPIHILSVWTLLGLPLAVHAARRGRIRRHRLAMINLFAGALLIAGAFTLLPGRIMGEAVFGWPAQKGHAAPNP